MGSALLRNGVCIVDLPGLGDLNHSRTAATNAIRRQVDFEIIVAKSDRVTTEKVVDRQIKDSIRASGSKNTILVLAKIDEFFLDNHSIEGLISSSQCAPFPVIKTKMLESEQRIHELEAKVEKASDDDADDDCVESYELIEGYQEYLKRAAQCAFIKQHAERIEEEMRVKFKDLDPDPIQVFSLSSAMNSQVKVLLGLSAEQNYESYHYHVTNKLPATLEQISRIFHHESKDDAYSVIRPRFKQLVVAIITKYRSTFSNFLESRIIRLWTVPSEKARRLEGVTEVVLEWANNVRWNTYNKVLREKGIVKKSDAAKYRGRPINWNEELREEIQSDIQGWAHNIHQSVNVLSKELDVFMKGFCCEVRASLAGSDLAAPLKAIAVEEWEKRQVEVLRVVFQLEQILKDRINAVYSYARTETDTRCMLSVLNAPAFEQINKMPFVKDWYSKQKYAMITALLSNAHNRDILDKISEHLHAKMKANLQATCSSFLHNLIPELELFDEHIGQRLPPQYEITEGDLAIRDALRSLLPDLQKKVTRLAERLEARETVPAKRALEVDEEDEIIAKSPMM